MVDEQTARWLVDSLPLGESPRPGGLGAVIGTIAAQPTATTDLEFAQEIGPLRDGEMKAERSLH